MRYLVLLLVMSIMLLSCESKSQRNYRAAKQRRQADIDKLNASMERQSKEGYKIVDYSTQPDTEATIPITHPDRLHSHIVMDKTITQRIDGNAYQRVLTYNYADSVYELYWMPIAVAHCITYHDTIHVAYPIATKPKH